LLASPIILGSIAQNVINVTDTAFLGRVGEVALGAAAIGGIFYFALAMLGWGFGIGTQIIIARRLGENKIEQIGITFQHALYFLFALAVITFVFIKFISPSLIVSILDSENIADAGNLYLKYRAFGIFFAFINFAFRAFYVGIAKTKIISITTIIMALFNIVLDYALIFGKLGFNEMGIAGAAIASVCAEFSATLFFILYSLQKRELSKYQLFNYSKFNLPLFKKIISTAFPVMMQNFISLGGWFVFFVFVEHLGETELAISNIIRSIYVVLMIPIWGFASAINTLVSFFIGKKEYSQIFNATFKTIKLCVLSVIFIILLFISFPEKILSIYTNSEILINKSIPVFYVVSGSAIGLAVSFIFFNAVSGTGKTKVSFLIETIIIIIYLIATYVLTNVVKADIQVVWCLEYLYAFLLGIISFLYLKMGKWQNQVI